MKIEFEQIGFVKTDVGKVPICWTASEAEVDSYQRRVELEVVKAGQRIIGFL